MIKKNRMVLNAKIQVYKHLDFFILKIKGGIEMDQIQGAIVQMLVTVILGLITLVGAYATAYLKKASDKIKLEIMTMEDVNQVMHIRNALDRLETVAEKTVNKIEQTTAKHIREAIVDGKIDRKELESLAYKAYEEIISTMEPEYVRIIQETLGDAKTYILNTIEEKVERLKYDSR